MYSGLAHETAFLRAGVQFGAVQTVEGFPLGSEPETGMRQRRIPGRVQ